jgi:hypothetical protein
VLETPPKALGTLDDAWWRWVIDFGAPGPDRGEGGKYLILPPGYDGPLPEGGFYVSHARTTRVLMLGRMFMENDDPKPAVDLIRKFTKIYPYEPGGVGTSVAEFLSGKARHGAVAALPETVFHEGSGVVVNTVPPNDFTFYEMLDEVVQREPATALDPELMGPLAAIGIIKGKPFAPDERMKKILTEALAVANATSRSHRTLDARSAFFYGITGITPAMSMRLAGIGSQYLFATMDAKKQYFDGAKTHKVTLPKGIPEAKFWSFTLYDTQTRSMLDTPQRYPRAGSQGHPSPAAEPSADGSVTIYFGPTQPDGIKRGNWIQTMPGKGWFTILRLYSPLEPFFTKQWRPTEIEVAG